MLEKVSDASLRIYVVWLPILGFDGKKAAAAATGLIPDSRAAHFWDREQGIGKAYAKVLGLAPDELAWDVYLVFPAGARWQAEAPVPVYWMHQMFYPSDNYLNGSKFRVEVEKVVARENRISYENRPARRVPRQNLIRAENKVIPRREREYDAPIETGRTPDPLWQHPMKGPTLSIAGRSPRRPVASALVKCGWADEQLLPRSA